MLVAAVAAVPADTPSALEQDSKRWTDLLAEAGPNLDGWVRGPIPPGGKLGETSQWELDPQTKVLRCTGKGGHEWLRWDKELGNFIYHVEWRFLPVEGKKGYNSGIYARNSIDARVWHQAQTGDASGGYLFGDTLVDRKPMPMNLAGQVMAKDRVHPAGQWNTFEITCRGKEMKLWVNGAVTNDWIYCQVPKGYVGLEAEGWAIEFRNVKVKPL
jgi:hypothetical protein